MTGHEKIVTALEARRPRRGGGSDASPVVEGKKRRVKENQDLMNRPLRWVQ